MSGWIKFEKDLTTDPRVLRMAKELDRRLTLFAGTDFDPCNASALPGVTLVCGALIRLWVYADSHAREDNTIDLGCRELDEMVGIPDFCSIMPADWLREIDEQTVELPGFQEHNGTEARKRALTQKRVTQHRDKAKRASVTGSNASALPDQTKTRPDQTKTREKKSVGPEPDGAVEEVFRHWQTTHGHDRAVLNASRRRLIRTALADFSPADLCRSISGYLNSPHHMGQNERATRYDAIEVFLRDAKHIEAGLRFADQPPRTDLSAKTRQNVAAIADWTPPEVRRAAN